MPQKSGTKSTQVVRGQAGLESGPADSRSPHFPSPKSQALSFKKCPDAEIPSGTDHWPSRNFLLTYLPDMGLPSIFFSLDIYTSVCFQNCDVPRTIYEWLGTRSLGCQGSQVLPCTFIGLSSGYKEREEDS